jgi:hypothetical protein
MSKCGAKSEKYRTKLTVSNVRYEGRVHQLVISTACFIHTIDGNKIPVTDMHRRAQNNPE